MVIRKHIDTKLRIFIVVLCAFSAIYLFFPFKNIINSDEYSYLLRGMQLFGIEGVHSLDYCHQYMLGWPIILGISMKFFGGVSALPLLVFLSSNIALWQLLKKNGSDPRWLMYVLLYTPLLLFGRLLMSDYIAYFVVIIFLHLYNDSKTIFRQVALAFVFVWAVYIRETNLILLLPLMIVTMWKNPLQRTVRVSIFTLAFVFLFSSINAGLYNEVTTIRPLYSLFQGTNLIVNFGLMIFSLLLLLPGGLYLFYRSDSPLKKLYSISVIVYILMFCFYDYNGLLKSSTIALITYPRYFIPVLPLLLLVIAHNQPYRFPNTSAAIVVLLFLCISMLHDKVSENYLSIGKEISEKTQKVVTKNYNEAVKVCNPFTLVSFSFDPTANEELYELKALRKSRENEESACEHSVLNFDTYLTQYTLCRHSTDNIKTD